MPSFTASFPKDPHQDSVVITTDCDEADKMFDNMFNQGKVIYEAAPAEDSGFGFVFEGFGAKIKIKGEVDKAVSTQIIETTQKQYAAHEGERITKTLIGAVSGVAVAGIAVAGMALWLKAPKATIVPKASFAGKIKGARPVMPKYAMRPYRAGWNKK